MEPEQLRFLGGERNLEGDLNGERDLLLPRAGLWSSRRIGERERRLGGGDKEPFDSQEDHSITASSALASSLSASLIEFSSE